FLGRENGSLGVQRVENGFDQDDVGTTVDQSFDCFIIVFHQLIKAGVAETWIVNVWRDGCRTGSRPDGARHKAGTVRLGGHDFISGLAGNPGGCNVQLVDDLFQAVICLGNPGGVEAVGFDNIGASFKISPVDISDNVGLGEAQQVVVATQVPVKISKAFAAIILLAQAVALDHRPHATIQDENALLQGFL